MNQPDYERYQSLSQRESWGLRQLTKSSGDLAELFKQTYPSVQSCSDCDLLKQAMLAHDTPVSSYSKNELERIVKALRCAAVVRTGVDAPEE